MLKLKLDNGTLTYGEAIIKRKGSLTLKKGKWIADELEPYTKLDKAQALNYYNIKTRLVFGLNLNIEVFYCLES